MKKERRLVSIRRRVPAPRRSEYETAWSRLHGAATVQGAHAWRFRSAAREDLYIEFLEFAADADPRNDEAVVAALNRLASSFADPPPAAEPLEEWQEIPG